MAFATLEASAFLAALEAFLRALAALLDAFFVPFATVFVARSPRRHSDHVFAMEATASSA